MSDTRVVDRRKCRCGVWVTRDPDGWIDDWGSYDCGGPNHDGHPHAPRGETR